MIWGDHGTVGTVRRSCRGDYIEGNDGDDTIHGDVGDDDLVGGGSANRRCHRRRPRRQRAARRRRDTHRRWRREDWMTGDNAHRLVQRPDATTPARSCCSTSRPLRAALAGTGGGETDHRRRRPGLDVRPDRRRHDAGRRRRRLRRGQQRRRHHQRRRRRRRPRRRRLRRRRRHRRRPCRQHAARRRRDVRQRRHGPGLDHGRQRARQPQPPGAASFGRAPIELFDVQTVGPRSPTTVSGGDLLHGDAGEDRIFGQGNGAQPAHRPTPATAATTTSWDRRWLGRLRPAHGDPAGSTRTLRPGG